MSLTRLSNFAFTFHCYALEKEMETHSSVLAWRIPGMGEPGGLPSMGSHRVRHDWSNLAAAATTFSYKSCPGIKSSESESEVAQSCPTLCDSIDCNLPGSSVHGIFQARVLEWVAISFSRRASQPRNWTRVSRIVGRCFTIWATREQNPHSHYNLEKEKPKRK